MSKEAMKLALEALKNTTPTGFNMESDKKFFAAIKALEKALAQEALDRKAENARELGLDYEPEQKWEQLSCYCSNCEILGKELARIEKQAKGEPVAVMELYTDGWDLVENIDTDWLETLPFGTKLYTTPPQRKPLTDVEIELLADSLEVWNDDSEKWVLDSNTFAKAIEAAHSIKE